VFWAKVGILCPLPEIQKQKKTDFLWLSIVVAVKNCKKLYEMNKKIQK
jgi:hypothetical protein